MMLNKSTLVKSVSFLMICLLISCQKQNSPLDKAINEIEHTWTPEQISNFADLAEEKSQIDLHFRYGMVFRNEKLRNPKDSTLIKYFYSLGIHHLDDMSSIVFGSLHRKLNGKSIDLKGQIKSIENYWGKIRACEIINTKRSLGYYDKYKIGDTILVRMSINESNNIVQYECQDNSGWIYNDDNDLLLKGIVKEKSKIIDTLNMFFRYQILAANKDSIQVLMRDIHIGDEINIDLKHDIIEDID